MTHDGGAGSGREEGEAGGVGRLRASKFDCQIQTGREQLLGMGKGTSVKHAGAALLEPEIS